MKIHLLSLGAGLLVGVIYGLIGVRSPAPPVIALLGLLGILVGEQIVPVARLLLAGQPASAGAFGAVCKPHIFGELPKGGTPRRDAA